MESSFGLFDYRTMTTFYTVLKNLKIDKQGLVNFFYKNKDTLLRKYTWKNKVWDFYVMSPLPYDEYKNNLGKHIDNRAFCTSYEFVYMPPGYDMEIHKDNYSIGSRIGVLLEGTAGLNFYDDLHNPLDTFDYHAPVLFDIRVNHNVINKSDKWRLSFFINFVETYDITKKRFLNLQ